MKMPKGFRYSGIHAGIKPVRRDLALIVSDVPAAAAGCFTQNKAQAAPVIDAAPRLPAAAVRAVVVNSGNANALTGEAGIEDARELMRSVAGALSGSSAVRLRRGRGQPPASNSSPVALPMLPSVP